MIAVSSNKCLCSISGFNVDASDPYGTIFNVNDYPGLRNKRKIRRQELLQKQMEQLRLRQLPLAQLQQQPDRSSNNVAAAGHLEAIGTIPTPMPTAETTKESSTSMKQSRKMGAGVGESGWMPLANRRHP